MITRRQAVLSTLAFYAVSAGNARAQDWDAIIQRMIEKLEADPIFLGATPLPADDPRWGQALEYLGKVPTDGNPYEVAKSLDASLPDQFRNEWDSAYANPLIVLLFGATGTEPAGDVTPWCAAFMSWCIERVGLRSTQSAASKSYRSYGTAVWKNGEPFPPDDVVREGDIAVFESLANGNRGHVAFYLGPDPDDQANRVLLLGGNQSDAIGRSSYRLDRDLQLHSIRRIV